LQFFNRRKLALLETRNEGIALSKKVDDLYLKCGLESQPNFLRLINQWRKPNPQVKCDSRPATGANNIGVIFYANLDSRTEAKIFKVDVGATDRKIKAFRDVLVTIIGRL